MPPMTGESRWSGWRSKMSSCRNSFREPWPRRPRPAARPGPRWAVHVDVSLSNTRHHFSALFLFKVIAAEGEMKASRALKEASLVIAESPSALQLRYLQTLNTIAAEKNSTIIFPLPLDLMHSFLNRWKETATHLTNTLIHTYRPQVTDI